MMQKTLKTLNHHTYLSTLNQLTLATQIVNVSKLLVRVWKLLKEHVNLNIHHIVVNDTLLLDQNLLEIAQKTFPKTVKN